MFDFSSSFPGLLLYFSLGVNPCVWSLVRDGSCSLRSLGPVQDLVSSIDWFTAVSGWNKPFFALLPPSRAGARIHTVLRRETPCWLPVSPRPCREHAAWRAIESSSRSPPQTWLSAPQFISINVKPLWYSLPVSGPVSSQRLTSDLHGLASSLETLANGSDASVLVMFKIKRKLPGNSFWTNIFSLFFFFSNLHWIMSDLCCLMPYL